VVFDFSGKGFVGGITIDRFAVGKTAQDQGLGHDDAVEPPRPLGPVSP
jgi:hypothetical protein